VDIYGGGEDAEGGREKLETGRAGNGRLADLDIDIGNIVFYKKFVLPALLERVVANGPGVELLDLRVRFWVDARLLRNGDSASNQDQGRGRPS